MKKFVLLLTVMLTCVAVRLLTKPGHRDYYLGLRLALSSTSEE